MTRWTARRKRNRASWSHRKYGARATMPAAFRLWASGVTAPVRLRFVVPWKCRTKSERKVKISRSRSPGMPVGRSLRERKVFKSRTVLTIDINPADLGLGAKTVRCPPRFFHVCTLDQWQPEKSCSIDRSTTGKDRWSRSEAQGWLFLVSYTENGSSMLLSPRFLLAQINQASWKNTARVVASWYMNVWFIKRRRWSMC